VRLGTRALLLFRLINALLALEHHRHHFANTTLGLYSFLKSRLFAQLEFKKLISANFVAEGHVDQFKSLQLEERVGKAALRVRELNNIVDLLHSLFLNKLHGMVVGAQEYLGKVESAHVVRRRIVQRINTKIDDGEWNGVKNVRMSEEVSRKAVIGLVLAEELKFVKV